MKKQAIFVLGMHRSGTSALTGMLAHLGAAMPKTLMVAQPENPKGYFESYAIMGLNDEILLAGNSRWDDWREMALLPLANAYDDKIAEVIRQEFDDASLIAIKDPRICRMVPLWVEAMELIGYEAVAILPYRHAMEVAQSLNARSGMPVAQALLLWLRHVLDAEFYSRGMRRAFVYMPDLLSDWQKCADDIAKILQIKWPVGPAKASAMMKDHLDPDLKRQTLSEDLLDSDVLLNGWIRTVFFSLNGLNQNENISEHQKNLDDVRFALDQAAALFGPAMRALEVDHEQLEVASAMSQAAERQVADLRQALVKIEQEKEGLSSLTHTLETSLTYERQMAVERQQVNDVMTLRQNELIAASEQKVAALTFEKQGFEGKLIELEQAAAALQETLAAKTFASEASRQALADLEREKDALSASVKLLESDLTYERQMALERQQVYEVMALRQNELVASSEQRVASLQLEAQVFEGKLMALEQASAALQETLKAKTADSEVNKLALADLEREKEQLSASVERLESDLAYERQIAVERQQLYEATSSRQNELLALGEQKIASLESEKQGFEGKLIALEQAYSVLQDTLVLKTSEFDANRQALANLDREKDDLSAAVKTLESDLAYERQLAVERQRLHDTAMTGQKEIITATERRVTSLELEAQSLEGKLIELEREKEALSVSVKILETDLTYERQMAVERQQVNDVLALRHNELLAASEKTVASLELEKRGLDDKIVELEKAASVLSQTVLDLEREKDILGRQNLASEIRIAEFEQVVSSLEHTKESLSASLNTLETSLDYERKMAVERQLAFDSIQAGQNERLAAGEREIAGLVAEKRELEGKIVEFEKASASLRTELKLKTAAVEAGEQKIASLLAEQHELEGKIVEFQKVLASLRTELKLKTAAVETGEQKIASLLEEQREFEGKIVEFEKTVVFLQAEIQSRHTAIIGLEVEKTTLNALVRKYEDSLSFERQIASDRQRVYELTCARQGNAFDTLRQSSAQAAEHFSAQIDRLESLLEEKETAYQAELSGLKGRIFELQADFYFTERAADTNRKKGLGAYLGWRAEKKALS